MKRINLLLISFLLLALLSAFTACTAPSATAPAAQQLATVEKGDIRVNITAVGNLVSAQEIKLTFGSSAKVKEVLVGLGDRVKAGQVLASLDTLSLERSLTQSQLNLKSAQQDLENAKEPRTSGSTTSAPDPLAIEIKEFQLQTKKLELEEAQLALQNAVMVAPFEGIIADVTIAPGDQVSATTSAIRLISPTKFKVTVMVNETDINKIAVGAAANVQLESAKTMVFPATVLHISPVATIQSNVVNYKIEVQFDAAEVLAATQLSESTQRPTQQNAASSPARSQNAAPSPNVTQNATTPRTFPQGQQPRASSGRQSNASGFPSTGTTATTVPNNFQLREGQTVIANITVNQVNGVLLVPNPVISTKAGKNYVTVVSETGVTEERAIQIGITDGQNTQVLNGLNENEQVLVVVGGSPTTTSTTQGSSSGSRQQGGGGVPNIRSILPR